MTTTVLNITLKYGASAKEYELQLLKPFTREKFIQESKVAMGRADLNGLFFSIAGKHMNLNNDAAFDTTKDLITDGCLIHVIVRLVGGSNVDVSTLLDIILCDLPELLEKKTKSVTQCIWCSDTCSCRYVCHVRICDKCFNNYYESNNWTQKCPTCSEPITKLVMDCPLCMETRPLLKVCHDKSCVECCISYFKINNIKFSCSICKQFIPAKDLFSNELSQNKYRSLVRVIETYHDTIELLKYIDIQLCRGCGQLCYNDSMLPQTVCDNCNREFCFFCNKDWDNTAMNNDSQFTCRKACVYEELIKFTLVDFEYGERDTNGKSLLQIPNQRCCPKCLTLGVYGQMCKYHECSRCTTAPSVPFKFCFYCGKSKEECLKIYHDGVDENEACGLKCVEPKELDFSIFPRFIS